MPKPIYKQIRAEPVVAVPAGIGIAEASSSASRWLAGSVLHGCNVYHDRSVACAEIDLGAFAGRSGAAAAGFAERFIARFVDARHWPPTAQVDADFLEALRTPAGAGGDEVLLQAVLGLERRLAFARVDLIPIEMARVAPLDVQQGSTCRRLVWETQDGERSLLTAQLALDGLVSIWSASHPALDDEFESRWARLLRREARRRVSSSTAVLQAAAHARGLPCMPLGGPHLLLGQGALQRRIYSSVPAEVSMVAARLSRDKRRTSRHLGSLGLPVTEQTTATTLSAAEAAARRIGYPVVVKPLRGRLAAGVSVGVADAVQLRRAFARAQVKAASVLVENFVPGGSYRLLVVGGKFLAALAVTPPQVVGDGRHNIAALIKGENRDPLRNGFCLDPIKIDDADLHAALEDAGLSLTDVPAAGTVVTLRTAANVAAGGVHHDVTDIVHPSHRALAERAAAAIGLDVAGVDVVSLDIAKPCAAAQTRIIEVNARPGLSMHVYPRHGQGRDVAGAMLDLVFPHGADGRLPTLLLIGRRGAGALARSLQRRVQARGPVVGVATRLQATVGEEAVSSEPSGLFEALAVLQRDARVQALIAATSPGRACREGLGLDVADVVAVLPPDERDDEGQRREALRLAVRAARAAVLVQADDAPARRLLLNLASTGSFDPGRLVLVDAADDPPSGMRAWVRALERAWALPD